MKLADVMAAALVFAVGGCQLIPGTTAAIEKEARQRLDTLLNDGPAARFRDLKIVDVKGGQLICGLVNAKNRVGAYVGWRRFLVERSADFAVISPDAVESSSDEDMAHQAGFERVYPASCSTNGYFPDGEVRGATNPAT